MRNKGREIREAIKKKNTEKETGEVLSEQLENIRKKFQVNRSNTRDLTKTVDEAFSDYVKKYEESMIVKDPGIVPIGQNVLMTCRLMSVEESGYYLTTNNFNINAIREVSNSLSETQLVLAVGRSCQEVAKGDIVVFDRTNFVRMMNPNSVHSKEVDDLHKNIIYIGGTAYLLMHERDLRYKKENK